MALNYSSVASQMANMYVGLKEDKTQDNPNQVPYPIDPGTAWMDNYISFYDTDSNAGDFSMASVVMVPMSELLRFDNQGSVCDGDDMMAAKISEYWVAQVTPGEPQIGSAIVSVSNDAAKIRSTISAYLCSQESTLKTPSYEHLFEFIESEVNSIIWTVTELVGGSPSSYSVTIA